MKARKKVKKTDAEVLEIYRLYHDEHWTQARLSREFNISEVQIGRYVRGVSRRDVLAPQANDLDSEIDFSAAPLPTEEMMAKAAEMFGKPKAPKPIITGSAAREEHAATVAQLVAKLKEQKPKEETRNDAEVRSDGGVDRGEDSGGGSSSSG